MTINERFSIIPVQGISDNRIQDSIIAAYSIASPSKDFFEKNIIISQDVLGTLSFEEYVNHSIAGIRKIWGGYSESDLQNETVLCKEENLPAKKHSFTIQRGTLQSTGQLLYFVQYFFAKEGKITIISSSTDDSNDLSAINGYLDTIQCTNLSAPITQ